MATHAPLTLHACTAPDLEASMVALSDLLHACVHAGASVGFVTPFTPADALAFWRDKVLPAVRADGRLVLLAHLDDRLVGTAQLAYDTPPNQPHRADAAKVLVHPDVRRRGIGRALMVELERRAAAHGRRLITLDTRTGDMAEPLYTSLGYRTVGVIPGYARDPHDAGRLDATTIMYKTL